VDTKFCDTKFHEISRNFAQKINFVFREIKVKIDAKFCEITLNIQEMGKLHSILRKKFGFYETLLLIKTKVVLSFSVF
jgi:hypothetical protein